jgi:FtsP/CotA-like multicopper oxidase with cupredoxin domain
MESIFPKTTTADAPVPGTQGLVSYRARLLTEERNMTTTTYESRTESAGTTTGHKGAWLFLSLAILAISGFAGVASAAPVDVANPGFEDPVLADGGSSDIVPGWSELESGTPASVIVNPTNDINAYGANVYRSNGSELVQPVGTVQAGIYTLAVEIGARPAAAFGTYTVSLVANDGTTSTVLGSDSISASPNANGTTREERFATATVTTDEILSTDLAVGQTLEIHLSGDTGEVNFDEVSLDFIPGPDDAVVYLKAQRFDKALPSGGSVAMWGFAACSDDTYTDCSPVAETDAPGPQIDAYAGYDLTINVQNTLPMPVSIMIPGQANTGVPTAAGTRKTAFAVEIAAASTGTTYPTGTYSFSGLKAGTYLYQSASYPSIQVPMGLYGAVIVHQDIAQAYPGTAVAQESLLLFSEVDPIQNNRVDTYAGAGYADGTLSERCVSLDDYNVSMTPGMPCTIDYSPMYFFINGQGTAELPAGNPGTEAMLRFANAGLHSHTPAIVGVELRLIAEDGNLYRGRPQQQSAALLAAGKTLDALVTLPADNITLQLFDRMPTFSNENVPNGGSLGGLVVGSGSIPDDPLGSNAVNDTYAVAEDSTLDTITDSLPGVLDNDDGLSNAAVVGGGTAHGLVNLNTSGAFTYTPDPDYSGTDSFTYSAQDTDGLTYLAQVTLNVSFVNDAPVANADGPYFNGISETISIAAPGVLGNDADVDGDSLTAELEANVPGLTLDADGSFSYTAAGATASSEATFQYRACDSSNACSAYVTVSLSHNPVAGLTLDVIDDTGGSLPADGYRWLVEEDAMWQPDPTELPVPQQTLATNFHKSHMPVVAQGVGAGEFADVALDPSKHYYVSVLPLDAASGDGHTIGGARILPGADAVTVKVNNHALPTAQISMFIFEDNSPTNGAVDGNEQGLGGFQITLEDAGGRYGISGGTMSQDAFGNPLTNSLPCFGDSPPAPGIILSCPDTPENRAAELVGEVLIKNLYQGKYGVITSPPLNADAPADEKWIQTSTIEGTKVIDAWVRAGEPAFFQEFGPAGWHVFVGFVNEAGVAQNLQAAIDAGATGDNSVSGHVSNMHMSRPPTQTLYPSTNYDALAHTQAWVGINSAGGNGANYAVVPAVVDEASGRAEFTINGLPDGLYQVVVWDAYLDQVIAYKSVTLPGDNDAGEIPVFQWFARSEHNVFLDDGCGEGGAGIAGDGIRQPCETGIPEQNVNLRWRDGTVNQAFPTDTEGYVPFDETFPFFHWQVLEVDYARFKPTGVTVTVDGGGELLGGDAGYVLTPQYPDGSSTTRTETGPVLTQGFQGFLGQTSVLDWGKVPYQKGENGGISGIVYYASTRAENNPRLAVGEPWEPGVPSATVRLYREVARDPALTAELPVINAGFETNTLDGWTLSGTGAITDPSNNQNAYDTYVYRCTGCELTQTTSTTLEAGVYTATAKIGGRPGNPPVTFGSYRVQLGVDMPNGFVVLAEDNNSQMPTNVGGVREERFTTSTVMYSAAADDQFLGETLIVRLIGTDEVNFDNVSLSYHEGTALALVAETQTDSWDDPASLPDGCPGADDLDIDIVGPGADGTSNNKCYDGIRNFNQVRPAVFDGGYAFGADGSLPPGKYVVEVVPPAGYELVKEEDNNVGFGDTYYVDPAGATFPGGAVAALPDYAMVEEALLRPGLAQPPCVGEIRTVPGELTLFPTAGESAPFAGALRPLCDRKEVLLSDQGQAAADFFLFTSTPVAGHFVGMILDDTAQEFNPLSPQFGEKWAPPFVPVSIHDYTGREISRIYSDQWGRMNGLLPSTFTANMPSPSGYAPAMLMTCMNDPGPIPDPANPATMIPDPQYNPAYSTFCYTFQYMPGTTTYLDTPVLPVSAFASGYNPPDCEPATGEPKIRQVDGPDGPGPLVAPGETLTIYSQGVTTVSNPAYEGPLATGPVGEKTITRDFGFGAGGTLSIGGVSRNVDEYVWTDASIEWTVPADFATGDYQLVVTNADGISTTEGVTVTVGNDAPIRVSAGQSIQAAIDAANDGDLILVGPGTFEELVIMWKPVRLQGAGPGATFLNGVKRPTDKILGWRTKMDCLFGIGDGCSQVVDPLPNQIAGAAGFDTEEGSAVTVVGVNDPGRGQPPAHSFLRGSAPARIDGFSITGGDTGGGVFANGYAHRLQVSNNRVFGNSGSYHGGIRFGRPFLELADDGPYAFNERVSVHNNAITQNGGLDGAGGGLSLMTGTDGYNVSENFVCGNFSMGDGGGIGHLGLSDGGTIANNRVLFNQTFNQGVLVSGGGVFIGGEPAVVGTLTQGAGDVTIDSNLIKGNQAGAGHGGGIRTQFVNGQDVANAGVNNGNARLGRWHRVDIINNMVVNNVAGGSGGGISMQDTARSRVQHNTIAHNDSTATLGGLIDINPDGSNTSDPLPAGLVTEPHSPELIGAIPVAGNTTELRVFSNPVLRSNIVWQNRAFSYRADEAGGARLIPELTQGSVGACGGGEFWELGVLGQPKDATSAANVMDPRRHIMTDTAGYNGNNSSGDPALVSEYCNGARAGAGPMYALPALDEGGNAWIEVRFGPLVPMGDYHIGPTSAGIDNANNSLVDWDIDGDARPQGGNNDRGADEYVAPPPATP